MCYKHFPNTPCVHLQVTFFLFCKSEVHFKVGHIFQHQSCFQPDKFFLCLDAFMVTFISGHVHCECF